MISEPMQKIRGVSSAKYDSDSMTLELRVSHEYWSDRERIKFEALDYIAKAALLRAIPNIRLIEVGSVVIYAGKIINEGCGQLVTKDDNVLMPSPSQKIWNHSPEFNWGYGGSGPAQLALALLFDVTGDSDLSVRLHQDFKWQFVAGWRDSWQITSDEIKQWVNMNSSPCGSCNQHRFMQTNICEACIAPNWKNYEAAH